MRVEDARVKYVCDRSGFDRSIIDRIVECIDDQIDEYTYQGYVDIDLDELTNISHIDGMSTNDKLKELVIKLYTALGFYAVENIYGVRIEWVEY